MFEEVQCEFERFLSDINKDDFCMAKYLDTWDYEDEYSHNEIHDAQYELFYKIKNWLKDNRPNRYIIFCNESVMVRTTIDACLKNVMNYERYIVK